MLGLSAAAALAACAVPPATVAPPRILPWPHTPREALRRLMDGNERFRSGRPIRPHQSAERLDELVGGQAPFAAILSCADSRVPVELVFDQGFGDLFVCRSAGNVAPPDLVGSLEYGTQVLGARVLMVLGHSSCGAVSATIAADSVPGQISSIFWQIRPAVERAGPDLAAATAENARIQGNLLASASTVLARRVRDGELLVVAAVYDLRSRAVVLV
jgi:carbonic anhydrase